MSLRRQASAWIMTRILIANPGVFRVEWASATQALNSVDAKRQRLRLLGDRHLSRRRLVTNVAMQTPHTVGVFPPEHHVTARRRHGLLGGLTRGLVAEVPDLERVLAAGGNHFVCDVFASGDGERVELCLLPLRDSIAAGVRVAGRLNRGAV